MLTCVDTQYGVAVAILDCAEGYAVKGFEHGASVDCRSDCRDSLLRTIADKVVQSSDKSGI